ncbi:hypothetical protein [Methylobacterium trifolii]|uniref:Uncharacterized protein n=1 Tax=Methylobacterium trifolii TaxID=1003092 RepID=A0ABQ4U3H9_9HYPH|nr:hypothetical protein [Methylobacterium trifolii]GJE61749.1 hypothetical protein MPOCJGCO_3874 [Methylobacterium trifolii]
MRDLHGTERIDVKTLAVDVPYSETASHLVHSIATSYPVHLADPVAAGYYFVDKAGCHEMW